MKDRALTLETLEKEQQWALEDNKVAEEILGFDNPTEEEIMSFFEDIYFENFAEDDHR